MQPGRGACLTQGPDDQVVPFRPWQAIWQQDLFDRHRALEGFVVAAPDLAHGPFPDELEQPVPLAEELPGLSRHAVMLIVCVASEREMGIVPFPAQSAGYTRRGGWVLMGTGRPGEPRLAGESARFHQPNAA